MLSYEAVILLAGFAAAAAVAAAAIADGAAGAADAVRSAADVRAGQLAAGRMAVIDMQHAPAGSGGAAYVTVAPAGGASALPVAITGAWDSAGRSVECRNAGGAPLHAGEPVRGPRTIVCGPSDGLVLAARAGGAAAGGAEFHVRALP